MQVCYYLLNEKYDTVDNCTELPYVGESYNGFEVACCHKTKHGWYRCDLRIPRHLDNTSRADMVRMLNTLRHMLP
jgi:hypothetical protein